LPFTFTSHLRRFVTLFMLLSLIFISTLRAGGGETFPAGHWAYDVIEQLVVRGHLTRLNDVAKPYERVDVARAILEADLAQVEDRPTLWLFNKLKDELSDELGWLRDDVFPDAALRVGLRPEFISDKRDGLPPNIQLPLEFQQGNTITPRFRNRFRFTLHFGKDFVVYNNSILQSSKIFSNIRQRNFASVTGYTEQAFIAYHSQNFRLKFGRDYIGWGYGRNSLSIGFSASPLDQLFAQFHSKTIRFTYALIQLNNVPAVSFNTRYVSATRADLNLFNSKIRLGFFQTTLFGGTAPQFRSANPFLFSFAEQFIETNPIIGADASIYLYGLNLYGSFAVDDWQAEKKIQSDLEPNLWSGIVGLRAANILRKFKIYGTDGFIEFTRVTNRTYHNRFYGQTNSEGVTFEDQRMLYGLNPLAHPLGTDFLTMELGVSHWLFKSLRVSANLLAVSKGEGNLYGVWTEPWLDRNADTSFVYNLNDGYNEKVPSGVVEKRTALTIGFFYQPSSAFNLDLQFRPVWISNQNNVPGVNKTDFQFLGRVMFELQPLFNLL
jgi:hypothetical protein